MALAWKQIEDAIRSWVIGSTGLAGKAVIWAEQNGSQPGRPYATLKLTGPAHVEGLDEVEETQELDDEEAEDAEEAGEDPEDPDEDEADPDDGQEITQTVVGLRELHASLNVYSDATTGEGTAKEYMAKARIALELPSVRDAFNAAGLALIDAGAIQDLNALLETKWQSRGQMDVRFRVFDTVTERTGYIETAEFVPDWE